MIDRTRQILSRDLDHVLADATYAARKREYFNEQGSVRGAFSSRELSRDPLVNAPRRERPLPAFRVLRQLWQ